MRDRCSQCVITHWHRGSPKRTFASTSKATAWRTGSAKTPTTAEAFNFTSKPNGLVPTARNAPSKKISALSSLVGAVFAIIACFAQVGSRSWRFVGDGRLSSAQKDLRVEHNCGSCASRGAVHAELLHLPERRAMRSKGGRPRSTRRLWSHDERGCRACWTS